MHIEHLTVSQIVLLALLVSFVSSIATGIVTVTLMDQAPPAVTETIDRVVERTVQTIAPAAAQTAAAAAAVPIEKTVIVKESDAVALAVASASPSVLRIANADGSVIALGVAVSPSSLISDGAAVSRGAAYVAIAPDGTRIPLAPAESSAQGIARLEIATGTAATSSPSFTPIAIAHDPVQLGETVVALSGLRAPKIATGIVTSIGSAGTATSTGAASGSGGTFETDIALDSIASGSAFINAEGALIGLYTIGNDGIIAIAGDPSTDPAAQSGSD